MMSEDEDSSAEQSQIVFRKKKTTALLESDDDEAEAYQSCSEDEVIQNSFTSPQQTKNLPFSDSDEENQIFSSTRKTFNMLESDADESGAETYSSRKKNRTSNEKTQSLRGDNNESVEDSLEDGAPHASKMTGKSFTTPQRTKNLSFSDSEEESQILGSKKKNSNISESDEDEAGAETYSNRSKNRNSNDKTQNVRRDNQSFVNFQEGSIGTSYAGKRSGKSFTTPQRTDSDEESQIFANKKKNSNILESAETYSSRKKNRDSNEKTQSLRKDNVSVVDCLDESEGTPYASKMTGKSFTTPRKLQNSSSSDSENIVISSDDESDVIDTSLIDTSYEESPTTISSARKTRAMNQPTLENFVQKMSLNTDEKTRDDKIKCKRTEYKRQIEMVQEYEQEMRKTKNLLSTIKLASLPDKGQLLRQRFEDFKKNFLDAQEKLKNMLVTEEDVSQAQTTGRGALTENWNNLEAGMAVVQPKTFGKKGLQQHNIQRALTADCLEQLHGSLKNCPDDENLEEDPASLKIPLMHHQKRALKWMLYRESQKPSGGILADDMGLGKTLTMISLVVKTSRKQGDDDDEIDSKKQLKFKGGTLVVCPASLIHQWGQEIETKLKRGTLSYYIYHGPKRESKPKRLSENDVVITTYSIVMNESDKNGAIFRIRWKRIILDEAHQIRNHKAQTSIACCYLSGTSRWALTGTPVHNKELDMYALLKFLRCSPFDDLAVWKRWVGDKGSGGGERLHTVISSLMLRRTKVELIEAGKLSGLPSKKWELSLVALDESEMDLYHKVLIFSQKLFAQFLHQRAEKNQDFMDIRNPNGNPNSEYLKMRQKLLKLNRLREVSQHEILVLLLRLRQICCHPSLIINMLQGDEDLGDEEPETKEELNLLKQLENLGLEDHEPEETAGLNLGGEAVAFKEAAKSILSPSHPIFARDRMSSKIKAVMQLVPNVLAGGDKIVMVSQWKSYLELVGIHLKKSGIKFLQFDGSVPTAKRNELTDAFNDPKSEVKVLLLSLTAGGVGLNLIGGNHLFLLDLHWNPQLESQAQDRIYRMGQKKDVHIFKFMTSDTIEERIQKLQENKLAIAENMISGTKQAIASKLSLQDLKMLFNM